MWSWEFIGLYMFIYAVQSLKMFPTVLNWTRCQSLGSFAFTDIRVHRILQTYRRTDIATGYILRLLPFTGSGRKKIRSCTQNLIQCLDRGVAKSKVEVSQVKYIFSVSNIHCYVYRNSHFQLVLVFIEFKARCCCDLLLCSFMPAFCCVAESYCVSKGETPSATVQSRSKTAEGFYWQHTVLGQPGVWYNVSERFNSCIVLLV